MRSGHVNTEHFKNTFGVPQGAIMSPILFNIVMAKLVKGVTAIRGVHVTAYDDLAIWTEENDHPTTDAAVQSLQHALDTFTTVLMPTRMEVSSKTHCLAVHGKATNCESIHLTIAVQPLQPSPEGWIRILVYRYIKTGELKSG